MPYIVAECHDPTLGMFARLVFRQPGFTTDHGFWRISDDWDKRGYEIDIVDRRIMEDPVNPLILFTGSRQGEAFPCFWGAVVRREEVDLHRAMPRHVVKAQNAHWMEW